MNPGNPYEGIIIEAVRELSQWVERWKTMYYGWTSTKILHEERVNQLLDQPQRESIWRIWPRRNPGRVRQAFSTLLRWRPQSPVLSYEDDCQPEASA